MLGNKAIKAALLVSMLGFVGLTLSTQASAACNLVSTKDGSALGIKAVETAYRRALDAKAEIKHL